ncbi:sialomucin core protein 24-like isoform X2 [Stegostoma tigrinum]|uniref:sialomucin core protein 24-like isoform X2 n=1 Tax=Stegostoma tigrinum TaxID=3053191 RepID=UPI0028700FA3|nr:sialomucin core protein 24-like isoform X2 [Stegostoma tigrinum]
MRVRIGPTAVYILFTQCFAALAVNSADATGQTVSAINSSFHNEGNSSGDLNKTGSVSVTEPNRTGALSPTLKPNPTSNSTTALAPGITVATSTKSMQPSAPDGSKTRITIFQTTPPHISSHYMPEASTSATFVSTATESEINATQQVSTSKTTVLKPTQIEFTETNKQPTSAGVTQPNTGSLYSIITTRTSGRSYNIPDDTLVISGGLYDESRVYNPNMTVLEEDDEFHGDYPAVTSKYSQFRLEFLPEEREVTGQGSSFNTFQPQT